MKKRCISFLIFFILLSQISAVSALQNETELLNRIYSADHLSLSNARTLLNGTQFNNPELIRLRQLCDSLTSCQGLFIQEGTSSKGKKYTATVDFYFKEGVPYTTIEYTNYGGVLRDAPVEQPQETSYLFAAFPQGVFNNHTQEFSIHLSSDYLHIQWEDTCDYILKRSSGDVSEYTNAPIPFEEREIYSSITGIFDKMLGDVKHQYTYRENEKTFYIYITMGENLRTLLLTDGKRMESQWNSILEGFLDITDRMAAAISLDIRDGIGDITQAHCTVVFVDTLNGQNNYSMQDTIAIIKDGTITFDLLKDAESNNAQYSAESSYTPTLGEKNALRSAKQYLDILAFSRSGLIDQLLYEGYSQREAEYAVMQCGADWNEQAAKSAANYLSFMAFSRSGLIDQLEYEGFTHEQAVYGVTQNGY